MSTLRSRRGIYLLGIALAAVILVAVVVSAVTLSTTGLPDASKFVNTERLNADVSAALQGAAPSAANSSNSQTPCECVGYVVNTLFGGPRAGYWPRAESMADTGYWSQADVVNTDGKRTRSQTAAPFDVIIMQHDAVVYANTKKTDDFEKLTPIGCSSNPCAGHIGIVLYAKYYNDRGGRYAKYYNDMGGGWLILMRSANWNGQGWIVTPVPDASCSNVVDAYIFVPNGDKVSFWRRSR